MKKVGVPFEMLDLKETKKLLDPWLQINLDYSYKPSKFNDNSFGVPLKTPIYGLRYEKQEIKMSSL